MKGYEDVGSHCSPHGLAQPTDFVLSRDYNAARGTFVDFAALLPASDEQCRDTQFKFVEAIYCLPERERAIERPGADWR